jgi:predicted RNase H-like HicB family nuclease
MSMMLHPDDSSSHRPPAVVRTNSVERTKAQVDCLLAILEKTEPYLTRFVPDEDDLDEYIDEEAQGEARKTFELVNGQLRNLVDDQARWSADEPQSERLARQVLERSLDHLAEQRRLVAEASRPSMLLRPSLRLANVGWVAWYGAESPTAGTLYAVGRSPAEALQKFDVAYQQLTEALTPTTKTTPQKSKARKNGTKSS